MPEFIEVSHAIRAGMKTYSGLPEPSMETFWTHESSRAHYEGHAEFYVASLKCRGNAGTYIDAPIHRFKRGADLAQYPFLHRLAHLDTVRPSPHRANRLVRRSKLPGAGLRRDRPRHDPVVLRTITCDV